MATEAAKNEAMEKLNLILGSVTRLTASVEALRSEVADLKKAPPARASSGSSGGGLCFPPYGRSKGQPVKGASQGDLEFYRNGCIRTLDDPSKARWHEKEEQLLAAIDAELGNDAPPPGDDGPPRG